MYPPVVVEEEMIPSSWAFEHLVPGGTAVVGSFSDEALLEEVRE